MTHLVGPYDKGPMFLVIIALVLAIPVDGYDQGTRAPGEDVRYVVDIRIEGLFTYRAEVSFDIYVIEMEGVLLTSDDIRSDHASDPERTLDSVESIIVSRAVERVQNAIDGASITLIGYSMDMDSLGQGNATQGTPVTGTLRLEADLSPSDLLPAEIVAEVDPGRLDLITTSLLQIGSVYRRSFEFSAGPGESLVYRMPSTFDPLGDGKVTMVLKESGQVTYPPVHLVSISGSDIVEREIHTYEIRGKDPEMRGSEVIDGDVTVDIMDLKTARVTAVVGISSVGLGDGTTIGEVPPEVTLPAYIGAGAVRYLFLEGIIDLTDMEDLSSDPIDELASDMEDFIGSDVTLDVSFDMGVASIELPTDGGSLMAVLGSGVPILATVSSGDIGLNLTSGYDPDHVLGLLNGGMGVTVDFDRPTDDRFDYHVIMPQDLAISDVEGEERDGRMIYEMPSGWGRIHSRIAPVLEGESVDVFGSIDLSEVESVYLMDAKAEAVTEIRLSIGWLEHSTDIFDMEMDLEYDITAISSDMIRILLEMGIIDSSDIEEEIVEGVRELLRSMMDTQDLNVTLSEDSLTFDGDLTDVDGELPIEVTVKAVSEIEVLDPGSSGGNVASLSNGYVPYHLDPALPLKTYQKTISLGRASDWNLSLDISFPSGAGVKGWIGEGDRHKAIPLETEVREGIPVLMVRSSPGEGDHIYLEVGGGPYMGFNNASLCFFGTWGLLVLVLMFVLIKVIVMVRKKVKAHKTVNPKADEEDLDPNKVMEGIGDDRGVRPGDRSVPTRPGSR